MALPPYRTTPALVEGIIQTQIGIDLTPFIAAANELTTDVCGSSGYSDGYVNSKMELIERWLSAHFYTVFDNQLAAAKAGSVSAHFQYKVDYGLRSSMYGQNAIFMDTAGNLAALTNTDAVKRVIKISVSWLGSHRRRCGDLQGGDLATMEE